MYKQFAPKFDTRMLVGTNDFVWADIDIRVPYISNGITRLTNTS